LSKLAKYFHPTLPGSRRPPRKTVEIKKIILAREYPKTILLGYFMKQRVKAMQDKNIRQNVEYFYCFHKEEKRNFNEYQHLELMLL
jgi:hypothetical protein